MELKKKKIENYNFAQYNTALELHFPLKWKKNKKERRKTINLLVI